MFIYRITNLNNGKVYIGQTKQRPNQRFCRHIHDAKRASKTKQAIHHAIAKYGVESFTFEVIDGANSESELNYKEIHHIHQHNSLYPTGYNLKIGSQIHTRTKKKISEYMKENYDPERMKHLTELSKLKSRRKVKGISKSGEVLVLNSLTEVKKYGGSPKHLSAMLNGKKTYKEYVGFYFEYINRPTIKAPGVYKCKEMLVPVKNYRPIKRIHKLTGEMKVYPGLKEVQEDGFKTSTISQYANKRKPNKSEYEWEYL